MLRPGVRKQRTLESQLRRLDDEHRRDKPQIPTIVKASGVLVCAATTIVAGHAALAIRAEYGVERAAEVGVAPLGPDQAGTPSGFESPNNKLPASRLIPWIGLFGLTSAGYAGFAGGAAASVMGDLARNAKHKKRRREILSGETN